MCCSVLYSAWERKSKNEGVLQCVAVCCSALQWFAVRCIVMHYVRERKSNNECACVFECVCARGWVGVGMNLWVSGFACAWEEVVVRVYVWV